MSLLNFITWNWLKDSTGMQILVTNDQELIYSMIWVEYDRLVTVIDSEGHLNKKSCQIYFERHENKFQWKDRLISDESY